MRAHSRDRSCPVESALLRFRGQAQLTDEFTRFTSTPDQVQTSLLDGTSLDAAYGQPLERARSS